MDKLANIWYYIYWLWPQSIYHILLQAAKHDAGNIGPLSSEKSTTTNAATSTGATYKLTDGQKSPNGKWLSKFNTDNKWSVLYTGHGHAGIIAEKDVNLYLMCPEI